METYITICKIDSQWGFVVWCRELKPVLHDNLEGWDGVGGGGSFMREGTYVYLRLIHVAVWQKPTQYCKAIILQSKISNFLKSSVPFSLSFSSWDPRISNFSMLAVISSLLSLLSNLCFLILFFSIQFGWFLLCCLPPCWYISLYHLIYCWFLPVFV